MNLEILKLIIKKAEESEDCKDLYPATIELITNIINSHRNIDIKHTDINEQLLLRKLEDVQKAHNKQIAIPKRDFSSDLKNLLWDEKRRIYRLINNYFEKYYIIDFEKFPKGLCGPAVFSFFENFKEKNYSFYNLELLIIFQYEINFINEYFRRYKDELDKFLPNFAIYNDCYHLTPASVEEIIPFIERFSNEQHCPIKVNKNLIEECDRFFINYLIKLSADQKITITEKQIEEAFKFTKNNRNSLLGNFLI